MATGRIISPDSPLVVIVGPTASGKTSLAIHLAKKYNGEIICADSRTIYKGMDIGTAKPTQEEQSQVPHWGIDLVEPGAKFSVADFKAYATAKIAEIRSRGHTPFLVGGSGLYIDAIVFDYHFGGKSDGELRKRLEALTVDELHDYCSKNNITLPDNKYNKRYLIRAIEQGGINKQRQSKPISNSIIVGISTDKQELYRRIEQRAEHLFDEGVVEEAILLGKKYGWDSEAFTGNIYRLVRFFLKGEINQGEMKEKFIVLDRRLAKKQLTWLRCNPYIAWFPLKEAEDYLDNYLAMNG